MQSSMANSSATRSAGEYSASVLPSTRMAASFGVRRASAAAIRFGEAMNPYAFWWCSLTPSPSKPS